VMMVWQGYERNEWATAIPAALAVPGHENSIAWGPGLFSLADTQVTEAILRTAGFGEVGFTEVHEPVYYGPDVDTAHQIIGSFRNTKEFLAGLDAATADRAGNRLRSMLRERLTADGVFFDSRAWIVTARRTA